jgi:thiamine transport system permease protein
MISALRVAFVFGVLGLGIVYPLFGLIRVVPEYLKQRSFVEVLFSSETLSLAQSTLLYSGLALSIVAGVSAILVAALFRARIPMIRFFFEATWILPGFMMALLVLGIQKKMGVVDRYGWHSVVAGWVLMGVPYVALGWLRAIDDIDDREIDAFRSLGGGPRPLFLRMILPKTWPMLQSLLTHQFYWYLVSFTLVAILGGGPPNENLEVAIYSSVHYSRSRIVEALAYACWQVLLLAAIRGLLKGIAKRTRLETLESPLDPGTMEWNRVGQHDPQHRWWPALMLTTSVFSLMMILMNPDVFDPVIQGVMLSASTAALTLLMAVVLIYLRVDSVVRVLGWISPMILSLAWWRSYALELERGPWIEWILAVLVVGVQSLLFLPWAVRFLAPLFKRKRKNEWMAAQCLGASPFRAWWMVEWPRMKPEVLFLFSMVWCFSLAEVSTVVLFSKGGFEPLSVWIQNQTSKFRIHEAWVGTLLMMSLSLLMIQSRRGSQWRRRKWNRS